ncbi:PE-PPE domain-containing protein [Mycolicibacterium duvalii]|nr:PE-PPE domain-containing protein [Mycolicibacterium duvalii]MCV7366926.1 PE-PPE domain-containing protein [Mycolicibacterium duvalii]
MLGVSPVVVRGPGDVAATSEWSWTTLADESTSPTALLVGGKGGYAELTDEQMRTAFGGLFADYLRVNVPFPGSEDFQESIEVGAQNLYDAVQSTSGVKLIGAVSQSAPAVYDVLRRLSNDPARPADDELTAFVYAYPARMVLSLGGARYIPLPETPYDVLTVAAEYDGLTDFPHNWLNFLAVLNAIMGAVELHVDRAFFDIRTNPTEFVEIANDLGGTTTHVLIPTERLPLLKSWEDAGFAPEFISFMDALLRPIIDSAYFRPKMTVGIPEPLRPPPATPTPDAEPVVSEQRLEVFGQYPDAPPPVLEVTQHEDDPVEPAAVSGEQEDRIDVEWSLEEEAAVSGDAEGDLIDRDRNVPQAEESAEPTIGDPEPSPINDTSSEGVAPEDNEDSDAGE